MLVLLLALTLAQIASSRTVLATVSDARNRAIVDVGVDDFVVREAGQSREVLDVRVADYPIVLLIDNSSEAVEDFDAIRNAAARFIARIGQRPVALGALSDSPPMLTTFQDERTTLTEKLSKLTAKPSSQGLVFQSAAAAAKAIHDVGAPFSAIVVISASPVDATGDTAGELLSTILDSGAFVDVVANRHVATGGPQGSGAASAESLRALTDQTRGQFTTIYSASSYPIALDRLADRLSTEMLIQYIVPPGAAGTTDVKVGVRLPGARVRGLGVK